MLTPYISCCTQQSLRQLLSAWATIAHSTLCSPQFTLWCGSWPSATLDFRKGYKHLFLTSSIISERKWTLGYSLALGVAKKILATGGLWDETEGTSSPSAQTYKAKSTGAPGRRLGSWQIADKPQTQAYPTFCGAHIPPSCLRLTLSGASSWTAWPHWGKTCIWNFPGKETSRKPQGQKALPSSSLCLIGHWAAQEDLPLDSLTCITGPLFSSLHGSLLPLHFPSYLV